VTVEIIKASDHSHFAFSSEGILYLKSHRLWFLDNFLLRSVEYRECRPVVFSSETAFSYHLHTAGKGKGKVVPVL